MNVDELDRNVTFIEDHPEQHNQRMWTCGTGACLAGHIALNNDYEVVHSPATHTVINGLVRDQQGDLHEVASLARTLLDATRAEADLLFAGGNTAETLRLMTKDAQNGEDITKRWGLGWVTFVDEGGWTHLQQAQPIGAGMQSFWMK